MSALATLARVARRRAEEIERMLAATEARTRLIAERIGAHDRALAGEQKLAEESLEAAMAFGAFVQHAHAQRRLIVAEQAALDQERETLRETLREAFVELKKIEILIEQQAERDAAEEGRREQVAMDDIATNMMRGRG